MASNPNQPSPRITLIGTGTIGLSFAAYHLSHLPSPSNLTIYDPRPDLAEHINTHLPSYLTSLSLPHALISQITLAPTLESAILNADIIQESGPETPSFKRSLWAQVERSAPADALLWSSTSGIPASEQIRDMRDKSRVVVVHPYNPPHIMPLLEIVPSPTTSASVISRTQTFWTARGRTPVVLKKECTGFVANRLAFALLREAIHLLDRGVVGVEELDTIVESSMGPRWAVNGPFRSYAAGGGEGGLRRFFENIGGTVDRCWGDQGSVRTGQGWEEGVFEQAERAYGIVDTGVRDRVTRGVLEVVGEGKREREQDGENEV
ncbi:hypothetical protein M011DRAFT_467970 [Sporormia fimetaria CBS 119925]|uniref:NAD(P)-binding protein n=1 Tax=Sporormia fimetaria CBS 119925 TaxID=1340428 RepID=A0A6A6VBJ2_9PLEO|nr:hypothetical protein M011DRAFT_467970 [Sporormia fimetaria CBS 119925]